MSWLHPAAGSTPTVDIRLATAVEEMIERIWATGPLDDLVNNAAGQHRPARHVLHDQCLPQALARGEQANGQAPLTMSGDCNASALVRFTSGEQGCVGEGRRWAAEGF